MFIEGILPGPQVVESISAVRFMSMDLDGYEAGDVGSIDNVIDVESGLLLDRTIC